MMKMKLCNGSFSATWPWCYVVVCIAVGFQGVSDRKGDPRCSTTRLPDGDWRRDERASCTLSAALRWEVRVSKGDQTCQVTPITSCISKRLLLQRAKLRHNRPCTGLHRKRLFAVSSVLWRTEKRVLLVAKEPTTAAVVPCTGLGAGPASRGCGLVSL